MGNVVVNDQDPQDIKGTGSYLLDVVPGVKLNRGSEFQLIDNSSNLTFSNVVRKIKRQPVKNQKTECWGNAAMNDLMGYHSSFDRVNFFVNPLTNEVLGVRLIVPGRDPDYSSGEEDKKVDGEAAQPEGN